VDEASIGRKGWTYMKENGGLYKTIRKIKLLMLDVDGVYTNGWLIYDSNGNDLRCFDSQDGTGGLLLKAVGIDSVFVTIRPSKPMEKRAAELGFELYVAM